MNILLFVLVLTVSLLLERFLHAVCFSVFYLMSRTTKSEQTRGLASMQVATGAFGSVIGFASAACTVITQVTAVCLQWVVSGVILFIVSCLLYVLFQYATDLMFELGDTYNSGLGASLQIVFVWPIKVLALIFEAICPIWNAVTWILMKLPSQILFQTVTYNIGILYNAIESFSLMMNALAMSCVSWVGSFICCSEPDGFCNPRCFDAGERVFDLLSPLAHMRNLVVWVTQWLREMCNVMAGPMDIVTYPFMDINFAKGVHFLFNSVAYLVFHVPAITVERCSKYKDDGAVMCIPDFDPVFNMLVSGFRYMGLFFDNWLDVGLLIVNSVLGRPIPTCHSLPDLLRDFDFSHNFFGYNETVMVGMTEYMFARTDGLGVQYFSTDRDWQTVLHPEAFPFRVHAGYGIAAISHLKDADHDSKGDDTTGLLGCACEHTSIGMQITCGVAMFGDDVAAIDRIIQMSFQLPSTGQMMRCNRVMIKVESIRWPVSRFTATKVQNMYGSYVQDVGCTGKGTCLYADAAVWIRPMCSVGYIDPVCIDSFKQAACFPYCMALHVRGSGTQALVLHDANEWNEGVTMLRRDCGLHNMSAGGSSGTRVSVAIPGSEYGLGVSSEAGASCVYNPLTDSRVPKDSMTEYGMHASIDLTNQPFLFAGDVALTAVQGQRGADNVPRWSIQVHRIFGNQANEFTTIPLNQGIPSLGPCTTANNCDNINAECQSASGCKAAIPYGYDASVNAHVLGATTQRYLFWVTNPVLEPFYAFSKWCKNRNKTDTNTLQFSVTSSYGGIRLWRINPYIYCPTDPNTGKQQCPEQQAVSTVQVSLMDFNGEFEEKMCDEKLDVMAVDMDYINEDNLALTMIRTTLANVDTNTLRPKNKSEAEWITVWVNPNTMEIRNDTLWMPEASSPALAEGTLCPSQRRMPNLGSLAAELASAMVFLIRMPLNVILSFPIIMDIAGDQCPVMTRGHSLLKNCGDELLSMEDFFSSIFRSNTLFWQIFAIVADSFGPGAPQTFINGMAIAGENGGWAAMMPGMAKSFSSVGDMDISKASDVISSTIATLPAPVAMARLSMKNPIAYTHFYYRLFTRMIMQIMQASQGTRSVGNVFWNVISDGRQDFESIVLQRMRRTCGGFAIMAGFTSPLGRLMNHWCIAWVEMQSGMLTLSAVFFVDIPLIDCVCVKSTGKNVATYIRNHCWADTPDLQKPMISSLISMGGDACKTLVSMTQAHFKEAMDPMFSRVEAGTREVGSVLDWFVHANYVGDCNNYADNPYVLALIPQPVDYFRVCGKTNACRLRCFTEFQAFELRNLAPSSEEVITKSVQSLFFNSQDSDTNMPLRPQVMLELHNCSHVCGFVQSVGEYRDRCFLLAGESSAGPMQVISFCVPIQIGSNVRRGGPAWTIENLVPGAFQVGFVFMPNTFDFWASFQLIALTQTAVWACHAQCLRMKGIDEFDNDVTRLKRMAIMGNLLVVEALVPDGVSYFTSKSRIYCMTFSMKGVSKSSVCTTNIWENNAWPVCAADPGNTCSTVLLLPRTSGENVRICNRKGAVLERCDSYQTARDFVHSASLSGTGIVSQSSLLQGDGSVWNVFMTTPPSHVSHWLLMCKVATLPNGAVEGSAGSSFDSSMSLTVKRPCSIENCVGCTDLGLQRMCYAAQQCQLGRCIGTMVHQNRPLCAIGMNLQALVAQQLSLVEGAWLLVSETMASVLALSGGVSPSTEITWPDQAFYGFICAAKDVSATSISIVMATINGVAQSIGQIPMVEAGNSKVSNNAMAVFTMTMAATTGFMNQLALGPLYGLMAAQKTFVCSANSIIALASQDRLSMTVGDASIQNSTERGLGKCMSQFFAENAQGDGSGTDNDQSLLDGAIQSMVNVAMELQLDIMMHPLDAMLTWMQGVVSGLQDVVQTIDRNR
jgi:hypothetical protein